MIKPPLILTLAIDERAFSFFNSLRQQYFPSAKNFINAHLTLFHALPNNKEVFDVARSLCNKHRPFFCQVTEPVFIGRGVAYKIESKDLALLHKQLQQKWIMHLSLQDKQNLWPHITIQNKVVAEEARKLLAELKISFRPFVVAATGLQLWEYLNGPWKLLKEYKFLSESV